MSKLKIVKTVLAIALCSIAASALALDDMRWFKNELICAETKVIVRSYCKNEVDEPVNSFCTKQVLTLETADKKIKIDNLLEKEPFLGNFHVAGLIRCVAVTSNKPYLYITLDNGGNCNGCEVSAIMNLHGKWKRYGRRWYVAGIERKEISRHENAWFKQESFLLKNKIEDQGNP
ncbi:MAG: hypothetical protein Q7R66_13165 [Undibacterium sp.]|uniref:hypothetical protein n=1 Tax=Undibacterium sp. TaxID=1914977 RepID=UPI002728CAFB|nr:hypothetical protein [Undibacterium sp.]MDO8653128.1 hypothetical protein [Undibacterium sp.]